MVLRVLLPGFIESSSSGIVTGFNLTFNTAVELLYKYIHQLSNMVGSKPEIELCEFNSSLHLAASVEF